MLKWFSGHQHNFTQILRLPLLLIFLYDLLYTNLQDDTLSGTLSSVDISTTKNLDNLVEVGEKLLKKPVLRKNIDTGLNEPIPNGGTNEDALKKYVCTCILHFFVLIS